MEPRRTPQPPRLAIVGAGPIGLEAALEGAARGFDVALYEAGRVGEHLRRFEWVRLFTPFGMNSSERGRASLAAAGFDLPPEDALLTAGEFVARYLEPISRLPVLQGRIQERSRVAAVGREGRFKSDGIVAAGDLSRQGRAFLLRVEPTEGAPRFDRADVVIDATGVYGSPRDTGPYGLRAIGEEALGDSIDRHLVPIRGAARGRYARRRVLLVGDGYSAATALADFAALSEAGDGARVTWIRGPARRDNPFAAIPDDTLPARAALTAAANRIARGAVWLDDRPGFAVESYGRTGGVWRVGLRGPDGAAATVDVDRILSLVGYQPDLAIHRELQIHLCYASEGTMALASAVLAASLAGGDAGGDCLKQVSHGAETLKNPEPAFYVAGAKSYGRNPNFLLTIGHRQVLDIVSLAEANQGLFTPVGR